MSGPYQPRYAAYLRTTNAPTNWDFMSWISSRWREWERMNGRRAHDAKTEADHLEFDAWLEPTSSNA